MRRRPAAAIGLSAVALLAAGANAHPQTPHGPFAGAALRAYLDARAGTITAAVEDLRTGRRFVYHPGVLEDEASIAKVDILATLLHETRSVARH